MNSNSIYPILFTTSGPTTTTFDQTWYTDPDEDTEDGGSLVGAVPRSPLPRLPGGLERELPVLV